MNLQLNSSFYMVKVNPLNKVDHEEEHFLTVEIWTIEFLKFYIS